MHRWQKGMMRAMKKSLRFRRPFMHGVFSLLLLTVSVQCGYNVAPSAGGYNWDTINYVTINRNLKAKEELGYSDVEAEYEAPMFGACAGGADLSNYSCK